MSEYNQYDFPQGEEEEENPIDWFKYLSKLLKYWKRIGIISFGFAVLSIVVALTMKRSYVVTVTLAPEIQSSSRSSLSSLAGMFGMNIAMGANTSDAFNITIFPEIVSSTPFLTSLFDVELSPVPEDLPDDVVLSRKILEGPLPKVRLYDHLTGRDKEKGFFKSFLESIFGESEEDPDYMRVNESMLTKEQGKVLKRMQDLIVAEVDKNTAMTTIEVRLDDKLMCMQLADTVCRRLREYVFLYRTEKERINFEYYSALCDSAYNSMVSAQAAYAESVDNDHGVVLQKVSVKRQRLQQEASMASQVYQQMVQQRESSRAQLQNMKPVFAVVEPATLPQRSANSKKKVCVVITFFGFVFTCAWYLFGKEWVEVKYPELKKKIKDINA